MMKVDDELMLITGIDKKITSLERFSHESPNFDQRLDNHSLRSSFLAHTRAIKHVHNLHVTYTLYVWSNIACALAADSANIRYSLFFQALCLLERAFVSDISTSTHPF